MKLTKGNTKPAYNSRFAQLRIFVVSSRSRFARNIILVENNRFRSSQLMRSGGTLPAIA